MPEGHATEEHASKHRDHGRTREKEQERDRKNGWERKCCYEHNREKRHRSKREDDKQNWKRDRRDWWWHLQWDTWTFCNNSVFAMLCRLGSVMCNLCNKHWHKCSKKAGNETLACPGCMRWTRNRASSSEQTRSDWLCGRDGQSLTMQVSERACWLFWHWTNQLWGVSLSLWNIQYKFQIGSLKQGSDVRYVKFRRMACTASSTTRRLQ